MKKMKLYSFVLSLIFVLIVGLFYGCEGEKVTINDSVQEVKVGLNLELTGSLAAYGTNLANGILMALDEINQAGGINGIKIIPLKVDNKSDPVHAKFLANIMMTQDGVVAAIGPNTSTNFIATIPAATQNKIPIISATATADKITVDNKGNVYEYVFRTTFDDTFQGTSMANFAINDLSTKKAIVILQRDDAYSVGLAKIFIDTFIRGGGSITTQESYASKTNDFTSLINRIKQYQFDVIYFPGYYEEAGLFIKQARDLDVTVPILGGDAFDSRALIDIAGATALNNVYYTTDYSPLNQDPLVQNFIATYKKKYGQEPDTDSARGYDAGKLLADAIRRANSTDPEAIKDALASTENFIGITGTFSIDKEHNSNKDIKVIGLQNGVPATSVEVELRKL